MQIAHITNWVQIWNFKNCVKSTRSTVKNNSLCSVRPTAEWSQKSQKAVSVRQLSDFWSDRGPHFGTALELALALMQPWFQLYAAHKFSTPTYFAPCPKNWGPGCCSTPIATPLDIRQVAKFGQGRGGSSPPPRWMLCLPQRLTCKFFYTLIFHHQCH